jgi:hypothetical protein
LSLRRILLIVVALAHAACGDDDPSCDEFIGDPDQPLEIELIYRAADGTSKVLVDGGTIDLITPDQGGKVALPGVRARNVDTCSVALNAALRDPCNNRVIALEQRPINLVASGDDDGWAVPAQPGELSDYANVPACPTAAPTRDVDGEPFLLEVRLTDGRGRIATRTMTVTPVCAEADEAQACRCECDLDYLLACEPEEPCPCEVDLDGGVPGTCPSDAAVPDAATGAVPDAATGAVPDAATGAVPDAATGAVPDAATGGGA